MLLQSRSADAAAALIARYRDSELGRDLDAESVAALPIVAAEVIKVVQARLEEGDHWSAELPPLLSSSIQYMARIGMPLDEVVRSYTLAGASLIEFIVENLGELARPEEALRYLASLRSANDDRMMAAFAAEYERELGRLGTAPSRRLAERVNGLLEGGSGDFADLGYRLDACHLGLVALGPKAELFCRRLAEVMGCELLLLEQPRETVWAWLGAPREISFVALERAMADGKGTAVAAGEPRGGVSGWRRTHMEARAAAVVALLGIESPARYSDQALLIATLASEIAGRALLDRYLEPLDGHRDGAVLRRTLRTYLNLDCNAASTAAALEVDRHTVRRRLGRVEEAVRESIPARRAEFDVALRLEQLTERIAALAGDDRLDHLLPIQVPARSAVGSTDRGARS